MKQLAYTYALIKSFHEQENDYIDALSPLLLTVLQSKEYSESSIQDNLKNQFDLIIPLHVIRTISYRLQRKKFVLKKEEKYILTKSGAEYLTKFINEDEIRRRLNELLNDLMQFLNRELNKSLNIDETQEILLKFIHKNIEPVLEFFILHSDSGEIRNNHIDSFQSKIGEEEERYLVEYIQIVKKRKPLQYDILKELILGSLISLVFSFDFTSITKGKKFKKTTIFLDTNILFSLLDVHFDEFAKPAKELLNLLHKFNFEVKVFDFTVEEATRVLNKCKKEHREYPSDFKVNSICANLEKQKMTKQDIEIFVSNIEDKIYKLGVKIEWTHIDVANYTVKDDHILDKMKKYKPIQPLLSQKHDILAIEKIKEIRKHEIRRIEDSLAFFLTSDGYLTKFNFIEMGHRDKGTICEVVVDRFLTSILWLKHPDVKLTLETLIAACYRDIFINVRIWERFYDILQELKQKEEISIEDMSSLLYHDYIEDVLCHLDETDTDKITQEFVLEKTKGAKEVIDKKEKESEKRLEKQQQEINALTQKIDKMSRERYIQIENSAIKFANIYSFAISTVVTMVLVFIIYNLHLLIIFLEFADFISYAFSFIIGSTGLYEIWLRLRVNLNKKLCNYFKGKKINEMELHKGVIKE